MKVTLTESELQQVWKLTYKAPVSATLKPFLTKNTLTEHMALRSGVLVFNPEWDFIQINNVEIPLQLFKQLVEIANAWETVTKAVQEMEIKDIVANLFFTFPETKLGEGKVIINKGSFQYVKKLGSHITLFNETEILEIERFIANVQKILPCKF